MEADKDALQQFKEDVAPLADIYLSIPDKRARACILTLCYYGAEHNFSASHDWYTPYRLLGPNALGQVLEFKASVGDFLVVEKKVGEWFLEWLHDRLQIRLDSICELSEFFFNKYGLDLLPELEAVIRQTQ